MRKKLFLKNGAIMAISALIMRSMSMMFRIYLTGKIGTEGIGIYQLILTVYAFFALICTSGLTITVTRLSGDWMAKGSPEKAMYVTERCMFFAVMMSTFLGVLMYSFSDLLAFRFLHEGRARLPLKLLAPSLPFMSFSAVLRGYFSAGRKLLRTAGEQMLEQITEIATCFIIFDCFAAQSTEQACCTAVIGTTAAEILSFFYSLVLYLHDKHQLHKRKESVPGLLREALPIALPCTASSGLRSALSAIENILIPMGLIRYGANSSAALSEYGIISGMAMPVIVFPAVLILPFASLIITEMSQSAVLQHRRSIQHMTVRMLTATLQYSLPVMIFFLSFSSNIGQALYHSEKAGFYIAALAPVIPLMYLDSSTDGILKGLNEQTSYLICNFIDSVIRVVLTYFLLPVFGTMGVVAVILFSELLNTSLSIARLVQVTKIKISLTDALFRPVLCALIPCVLLQIMPERLPSLPALIIKLCICILFYLTAMFLSSKKIMSKQSGFSDREPDSQDCTSCSNLSNRIQ